MDHANHHHNLYLVGLSILIAIISSYTALDLVHSVSNSKGKFKIIWLSGSSLAMGIGIWSMHFIGMLAFTIPGVNIYYHIPQLILSIIVAILASSLAFYIVSSLRPTFKTYLMGSFMMGGAIAGMHYIGIKSMRLPATIEWNTFYVILSIVIAFAASLGALLLSFKIRNEKSESSFVARGVGGILMGIAIFGMHYTGMIAMKLNFINTPIENYQQLLATDGLATSIIVSTLAILGIALIGSNIERALFRRKLLSNSLQAAIKARDEFLSIASHELRTPLTTAKLGIEMSIRRLQYENCEKEKVEILLKKTNKSLNRIIRLVDDMLDVSRFGAGKLSLNLESADLGLIIKDVIESMNPQFESAGVKEITFHPIKALGKFDVFRIEQVFTNLLSNSLKYGQNNPVEVTMKIQDKSNALIAIQDHGIGISEENLNKIFKRFERVNGPTEIAGLGLGLSIVEDLVTAHNGNIWVESQVGKGSTFFVLLPITP